MIFYFVKLLVQAPVHFCQWNNNVRLQIDCHLISKLLIVLMTELYVYPIPFTLYNLERNGFIKCKKLQFSKICFVTHKILWHSICL